MNMKKLLIALLAIGAVGCAIKADVVKHDDQSTEKAKNFIQDEKLAKIYFLTSSNDNFFKIKTGHSADFKVNGITIGSINDENVMYFKLVPGTYKFEWRMRSTDIFESRATSVEFPYRVAEGDVIILRGKYNAGGASSFGLIGALMSPPKYEIEVSGDRNVIKDLVVAAPQSCPQNICVTSNPTSSVLPVTPTANKTASQKLVELDDMRKKGLITQKDFDTKKSEILKGM
jgi:hypothetical protein